MGSCCIGKDTAEYHMHTDIRTCNIEKPAGGGPGVA